MKRTIFDIDNCLADDSRRIPKIRWDLPATQGRWNEYHADCGNDKAHNVDLVKNSVNPVFLTARPVIYHDETVNWLRWNYKIENPTIIMRNKNDMRCSRDLKDAQLTQLLSLYDCDGIVAAYDDREDVVNMYRERGITAAVLKIHDVCAYTPPEEYAPIKRAPDLLSEGGKTFKQRNEIYGDTYLNFGAAAAAMFPDGLKIDSDAASFNRLGIFVQCLGKMMRYASNLEQGGHQDSAHDLMVYAAMLEETTK